MADGIFNIRVYGFLTDEGRILVTDEFRLGINMTKFPGGGLKYGEGIIDCLKREFIEELDTELISAEHYYTTENFFSTKLLPFESQLINVYYKVTAEKPYHFKTTEKVCDFPEVKEGAQCFRWIRIEELEPAMFTFPIDRFIAEKIKKDYHAGTGKF